MTTENPRREQLADAATDYVLEHGLIGLSLRPLAAELDTSDRMLIYHFGSKDDLVATVLRVSNDRSVAIIRALPTQPDVRQAVVALWEALNRGQLARCQRLYIQAAALGLLGREPYLTSARESNELWVAALAEYLVPCGMRRALTRRAAWLMDAAMLGLMLDLPLDAGSTELEQAVVDLADAVAALAETPRAVPAGGAS